MHFIRYSKTQVSQVIHDKMIFIGGPRQFGKSTFAKSFITSASAPEYLTWDVLKDRKLIQKNELNTSLGIVALDEIHKYLPWRTLLKGLYDKHKSHLKTIVNGSEGVQTQRFLARD